MAITFSIAGVDRLAYLRGGTLEVDKQFGVEVCRFTLWDRFNPGAGALRPALGAAVYVQDDGSLVFGGEIVSIEEEVILKGASTPSVTILQVTAKGYEVIAERILVPYFAVNGQDVLVTAQSLFATYLQPRGVTNIGATSGGPSIGAVEFDHVRLSDIFDRLASLASYYWRINGDKQFAFVAPGALTGPAVSESILLEKEEFGVEQSRTERQTRLYVVTGGDGAVLHSETRTANGTHTVFPCNVEPGRRKGQFRNTGGYVAGTTAATFDGLYPSQTLKAGDTFSLPAAPGTTYTVTGSDVVGSDEGLYTGVTFTPGLAVAVEDNAQVSFDARTFVRLEVNGVDTSVRSGAWSYDAAAHAFTRSTAPGAGTTLKYISPIVMPALVRVWDTSLVQATGAIDSSVAVDGTADASSITDLAQAKAWGDVELVKRAATPKVVRFSTRTKGFYPLQRCTVSLPNQNFSGIPYLVQNVAVRVIDHGNVLYQVEAIEGNIQADQWWAFFDQGTSGSAGSSMVSGGTAIATPGASSSTPVRIALGGDNYFADNSTAWLDVANAVPVRLGGTAMAGTWTLRVSRYVKTVTSPTTSIELRLYDTTNAVVLATVAGITSTSWASTTQTFSMPATAGVCLLQYRMVVGSGTASEGVVGQCTLERD